MEYGLQIRNQRTGRMIELRSFAKVFHQFSGRADGGFRQPVPSLTHLLRPHVNAGRGHNYSYSGELYAYAKPITDFGLSNMENVWHALTPIFYGNINQLEGNVNDLESCTPTMCIYNPDDHHFYTSRSAVQKRSEVPPYVIVGVSYA